MGLGGLYQCFVGSFDTSQFLHIKICLGVKTTKFKKKQKKSGGVEVT